LRHNGGVIFDDIDHPVFSINSEADNGFQKIMPGLVYGFGNGLLALFLGFFVITVCCGIPDASGRNNASGPINGAVAPEFDQRTDVSRVSVAENDEQNRNYVN
jgi:hypothetical protein